MRFLSTRGRSPAIGFRDAVMSGLAPDGGLYMPERWPQISAAESADFAGKDFAEVAAEILALFSEGEVSEGDFAALARRAFDAFDAPEVAPLRQLDGDTYLLELFHGPTLAFKDVAMRTLSELYDWALEGAPRRKTIIGATSGDTGAAAISAFAGSDRAEIFMLHPKGRVSEVQRRMMTTVEAKNVVNLAVDGSFDDCQRIVKALFADEALGRRFDLGAVNSINVVRLLVQTVYYFTATAALGRPATFVVPTGNFGDIFAGYAAHLMGLPVDCLVAAVNSNDVVKRALVDGIYAPQEATPTSSPSMDIQSASNFERLLFEAGARDSAVVSGLMESLARDGRMTLPELHRQSSSTIFAAESATDAEVDRKIRSAHEDAGVLVDPHTAVGLVALEKLRAAGAVEGPAICLATAHPAKFPETIRRATGVDPALPSRYADLMRKEERMIDTIADAGAVRAVIVQESRA